MKVVKVYGPLRKYLGQCRFEFVADTPAQAMKALCVNFPGLAQWLLDREAEGMAFRVTRGRDKITNEAPEGLVLPWSEREVFSIAPVIVGAGRGMGTILAGIALVAVGVFTGGVGFGFRDFLLQRAQLQALVLVCSGGGKSRYCTNSWRRSATNLAYAKHG
jgi:predicted phage tail protein